MLTRRQGWKRKTIKFTAMNNGNQKLNFDAELKKIAQSGGKSVLLHACCAPCATHALSVLQGLEVTLFYYNPNIMPQPEYDKRGGELARLADIFNANLVFGGYENQKFLDLVKGLEGEKEGGARCPLCFSLRLQAAADFAKANGFDYFCTTLTLSPHKNSELINNIGNNIAAKSGVNYLASDFKKAGGYQNSIELCRKHGIYRQNYCGCKFD